MPTWDTEGTFSTDTSWDTVGNWSSGEPGAGEHALLRDLINAVAGSDQSANDLGTVWIDNTCAKKVGSDGAPVELASNLVVVEGIEERHIKAAGNGIDYLVVNMNDPGQLVVVHPSTSNNLLGVLLCIQGRVRVAAESGRITRGVVGPNARLEVVDGAGGFDEIVNDGGTVESEELITKLYNNAGTTTQVFGSGASVTNAYCKRGSVFNYDMSGTIAYLDAKPGAILDFARTKVNKTVTASLVDRAVVRGGAHLSMTPLFGDT